MYDKENWRWIDPDTQIEYDLRHMQSFDVEYEVKLSKSDPLTKVNAKVSFSNHCFSRSKKPDDADRHVISIEPFEERVFCPERWAFSRLLPGIIRDLTYKVVCKAGKKKSYIVRRIGLAQDLTRGGISPEARLQGRFGGMGKKCSLATE